MNRLNDGLSEEIRQNRSNINSRLEEMRKSVIPSFWYSFFKSSWLIAMIAALILFFFSGGERGIFIGANASPIRIIAIALIAYGVLADLVFAPLAKMLFIKRHPQYSSNANRAKKSNSKNNSVSSSRKNRIGKEA